MADTSAFLRKLTGRGLIKTPIRGGVLGRTGHHQYDRDIAGATAYREKYFDDIIHNGGYFTVNIKSEEQFRRIQQHKQEKGIIISRVDKDKDLSLSMGQVLEPDVVNPDYGKPGHYYIATIPARNVIRTNVIAFAGLNADNIVNPADRANRYILAPFFTDRPIPYIRGGENKYDEQEIVEHNAYLKYIEYDLERHINNSGFASPFISTTKNLDTAKTYMARSRPRALITLKLKMAIESWIFETQTNNVEYTVPGIIFPDEIMGVEIRESRRSAPRFL
jgi:hypothetical protein